MLPPSTLQLFAGLLQGFGRALAPRVMDLHAPALLRREGQQAGLFQLAQLLLEGADARGAPLRLAARPHVARRAVGAAAHGTRPSRIALSLAASMLPPETTHTVVPAPA